MAVETTKWDIQDHLNTPEEVAAYLQAAFEDGDQEVILAALGDVARAKGMSQIAKDTGLSRESLYRSLSEKGNPDLSTVMKVFEALGLRFMVQTI